MLKSTKTAAVFILIFSTPFIHSCKTPAVIATRTIHQADDLNNQKKYNEAIACYERYIQTAPGLGVYRNLSMEADVYRKLAHAWSAIFNYDSSLYCLQKALMIDSVHESGKLGLIEDYRSIGLTYGYKGDYIKSISFLRQSLELGSGMEKSIRDINRISIGDTWLSLARVNFVTGNFHDAENEVEMAIPIYQKAESDYSGLLESYLLLGKIRIEKGEIPQGRGLIEYSMQIAESSNVNTARHYQAIGSSFLQESKYEEALKNMLQALKESEESNIIPQIAWMNIKVGDIYSLIGDEKKAGSYYETALSQTSGKRDQIIAESPSLLMRLGDVQMASELYIKSGSLTGSALAGLRLGEMNERNNNRDKAEYYFTRSDSLFRIIGSNAGQAHAKLGLCRLYTGNDMPDEASRMLDQIGEYGKNPEIEWQIFFEKGRILEKQSNPASAFQEYLKSIDIIERIRGDLSIEEFRSAYMKDKMHVYEKVIMLLLENNENDVIFNQGQSPVETAFYYSERARARAFLDMLGNTRISPKNTSDTIILAKEYNLRLQIQKVTREIERNKFNQTGTGELEIHLESLNREYIRTLDIIKLGNSEYNSLISVDPCKLSEIQDLIAGNSAIIQYWEGRDRSAVWVLTNKAITARILDTGSDKIEKSVSDSRALINSGVTKIYELLLAGLYNTLIVPIEQEIGGYESLFIIPHGSLHFLPFQALIDTEGKYLVEKFNVSYAPSSSVLKQCSLKKSTRDDDFLGLALGDINLPDFSPLPGTRIELNQIVQLYPGATAKYEDEISESYFKKESENHNIIHLATHGFLDSRRPMNSYLLMPSDDDNDGQLTVNEIFDLNLKSKLVVLSACETGLGHYSKGDELIGLSRAFIYAGTPSIIVSLWPVEDASTTLLMTRLYQYYTAGYLLHEALALAQRDLINNNFEATVRRGARTSTVVWDEALTYEIESGNKLKEKNPFYWAPFILIGYGGL
ncbi:MAG: CHAT domain-containing protein [Bacteroidales bacterium]